MIQKMKSFKILFFFIVCTLDYAVSDTIPEPKFRITPLGHFGLLIKCEIQNQPEDAVYVAEYTIEDAETGGKQEKYFIMGEFLSTTVLNLSPDSKYRIQARVIGTNLTKPITTLLEAKTNKRSMEAPFKPDFSYKLIPELYSYSKLTIIWLPCGKQYDCGATPAGEHFYVKYREKGENTDLLINRHEFVDKIHIRGCRPGKTYKFTVVSVYGQRETESESQEITFPNTAPDLDFVEVLVNEDVVIPCKLPNSLESQLIWNYSAPHRSHDQVVQLKDGSLSIKKVSLYDSGTYECSVPNSNMTKTSFSTYLDVKDKTSIQNGDKFKEIVIKAGDPFEFPCIVKNDETMAVFVDWLKNDEPVDASSDCELKKEKNNQLVISNTTSLCSGKYTCVAKTKLDTVEATLTLSVV